MLFESFQHLTSFSKRNLFSMICQQSKQALQLLGSIGMHNIFGISAKIILQCGRVCIILTLINLTRSYTVAEHFNQEVYRHLNRLIAFRLGIHIIPVLKMMTVTSLMVHPRYRIAVLFSLRFIGTSHSLIIPYPHPKLSRAVFGKIMKQ